MSRTRLIFSEAFGSLASSLSTTFAAALTVLIAMFLLGVLVAFGTYTLSYAASKKRQLVVTVYLQDAATQQQKNVLANRFERDPLVKSWRYVSKDAALRDMKKRFPELFKTALPANPLPASYVLTPRQGEDIDTLYNSLQPLPPGVSKVKDGKTISHRILRAAHLIDYIFIVGVTLLVLASTLLIANTIRLSIFSRRREIEVMKLVGATNWFVRGPFMLEGLMCGFVGAGLAGTLLILAKWLVLPRFFGHINGGPGVHAWPFEVNFVLLVAVGLTLGAAGSGLTLRRFLKV